MQYAPFPTPLTGMFISLDKEGRMLIQLSATLPKRSDRVSERDCKSIETSTDAFQLESCQILWSSHCYYAPKLSSKPCENHVYD